MGSCQSSSAAAVDERMKRMDAAAMKRDEEKYCYIDDNGKNGTNGNNNANNDSSTRNPSISSQSSRHEKVLEWKDKLHDEGHLAQSVVHIETSLTKRVEDIYDGIHDGPILGSGAAGIVRKCKHRETGFEFAVKCLNVGIIEDNKIIETLREEIFIMCQADHPDIIRLEEVYESPTQIYLIENLLTGGDMFDRLEEQTDYRYTEIQCAKIVKQMMNSIRYLHSKKVIHRDLKLENFLFDDEESDNIRLIDFGLSKHFNHDGYKHCDVVGTPYTIAPEMIKGEYDEKVDVWALGVITYLLLSGDPPFGGMDGEALVTVRQNILKCNLVFEPTDIWDNVSDTAKNFISRLLTEDPTKRPSAAEAQKDEWLTVSANMDPTQSEPFNAKLINNLVAFKDYSNLHKILLEVVSFTLTPVQIKGLRHEFEKIDRDGRGEITLDDLKEVLLNRVEASPLVSLTTEEEVEAIFDSLRLKKTETTIRWHEFIAAGLSRADYDNRNLRLAFNRFDKDGKGYITLDDISDLISTNDGTMDKGIIDLWRDGMKACKCSKDNDKMYFEDFEEVMKGRQRRISLLADGLRRSGSVRNYSSRRLCLSAPERDSKSESSIGSSGQLNDRLSSSHILTSTLAMRSSLRDLMIDSAIDKTKSGEDGGMAVTGTTSITAPRRGSAGMLTGGGALLMTSRRQLSNLTPVAEKTERNRRAY